MWFAINRNDIDVRVAKTHHTKCVKLNSIYLECNKTVFSRLSLFFHLKFIQRFKMILGMLICVFEMCYLFFWVQSKLIQEIKFLLIFLFTALPHMQLLSIQATSPERRFTQKEIIAGEERPKYLLIKQLQDAVAAGPNAASTGIFFFFHLHTENTTTLFD